MEAGHLARPAWRDPMNTIIVAALTVMIGIGAANAKNATLPIQQENTADWANG